MRAQLAGQLGTVNPPQLHVLKSSRTLLTGAKNTGCFDKLHVTGLEQQISGQNTVLFCVSSALHTQLV